MEQAPRIQDLYPRVDAVEAGLLDHLDPRSPQGGQHLYYKLRCPSCRQMRAYYYPGNGWLRCNRRNQCGELWSITDAIDSGRNVGFRGVYRLLCDAAGVARGGGGAGASTTPDAETAIRRILVDAYKRDESAQAYLADRGYGPEVQQWLPPIGYYPDWRTIEKAVRKQGIDVDMCIERGILPDKQERERKRPWPLDGRIVVTWPGPDGGFGLYGRRIGSNGHGPKTWYTPGIDLSVPWGWRHGARRGPVWLVEGLFDRLALEAAGAPAAVVGGNAVNHAQAATIAADCPAEVGFVTDGGRAGVDGALQTIDRLEALGVPVSVVSLPADRDDIDAIRRDSGDAGVKEALTRAMTGGEYIGRTLITAMHRGRVRRHAVHQRALSYLARLTPASRNDLYRVFDGYGWSLAHESPHPAQLFGRLLDAGLDSARAGEVVQQRSGIDPGALIDAGAGTEVADGQ